MATVIPLHETQEAVRVLVDAFRAPSAERAPALETAVATLIHARAALPRRVVQLIDSLLVAAQPGASPATIGTLVTTLADALHANAPSQRTEGPSRLIARGEDRRRVAQLQLFS